MKEIIRKSMLEKRKNLTLREIEACGVLVYENLLKIKEFLEANSCFCYCDFKNEVPTKQIREHFKDKTLYEPIVKGEDMHAVVKKGDKTFFNVYGIEEPTDYEIVTSSADVSIIPLVACDRYGNRIGFGKGFYDGYLKDKNTIKIGVCYSWQIVDFVQKTAGDVRLDYVVSEQEIIKVE